ncbi:hypothetical protein TIFTF001_039023 [Ficus carica]|uniref:Uncharacterized protein n=1 Tax=Ficus carica TaxID=3494 RepID=A0AA88E930_FICCA|nr:hypothetical protein TIFTF001_039023 [Ficus carica]
MHVSECLALRERLFFAEEHDFGVVDDPDNLRFRQSANNEEAHDVTARYFASYDCNKCWFDFVPNFLNSVVISELPT